QDEDSVSLLNLPNSEALSRTKHLTGLSYQHSRARDPRSAGFAANQFFRLSLGFCWLTQFVLEVSQRQQQISAGNQVGSKLAK
ncbi:MAG TPA: hypothetical protein VHQ64_14170, partial [Pyrinomonadaceae bacterium]|nr:hypothetical protein [Pyrinomonadaceae bacterium]